MRVREQNEFHVQLLLLDALQHSATIGAGIERHRFTAGRIPDEIGVHRHVSIGRIELGESLDLTNRFRIPFPGAELAQCLRIPSERWSDPRRCFIIERAVTKLTNTLGADARRFRELTIRDAQAAVRFADDVAEIVLERYGHWGMKMIYLV